MIKFFLSVLVSVVYVSGHGRLVNPPGRATMWRMGYDRAAINYDDTQLFCGGFDRQYEKNDGKCGICGDAWDEPNPRAHEDGGLYGQGIVTGRYEQGDQIEVHVEITAHHKGYFEFKLCPVTEQGHRPDQDCLDQHPIYMVDGSGYKYYLPLGSGAGVYKVKGQLPQNLVCERCVLQWHYYTANRWGTCKNGTSGMGCGPQETFRGCSDVSIKPKIVSQTTEEPQSKTEQPGKGAVNQVGVSYHENVGKEDTRKEDDSRPESNQGCARIGIHNQKMRPNELNDDQKIAKAVRESRLGKYLN